MNKRGQALIEFVLILPVLILLVFAVIDFGRIISCRMHLEGLITDVIELGDDQDKIDNFIKKDDSYKIKYSMQKGEFKKVSLETKLELITPGLKNILKNPYKVVVERNVI